MPLQRQDDQTSFKDGKYVFVKTKKKKKERMNRDDFAQRKLIKDSARSWQPAGRHLQRRLKRREERSHGPMVEKCELPNQKAACLAWAPAAPWAEYRGTQGCRKGQRGMAPTFSGSTPAGPRLPEGGWDAHGIEHRGCSRVPVTRAPAWTTL